MKFDEIDRQIIELLLGDSRLKKSDIAKKCGLSIAGVLNRINLMKKRKLIIGPFLSLNMASFGYPYPVTVGVNLHPSAQDEVIELIREHTVMAGINKTFGEYDLCLFGFAKDLRDMDRLKNLVLSMNGVNNVKMLIWNYSHLNYSNINLMVCHESV